MCTVPYTFIQMLKELRSGTYNNSAGGTYCLLFMNPIPDIKRGGWRFQATNHFVRDNGRLSEAFIKNYDLEIFPGNAQSNFQHREGHRRLVLFLTVSSKGSSFESPFEGNKFVLFFLISDAFRASLVQEVVKLGRANSFLFNYFFTVYKHSSSVIIGLKENGPLVLKHDQSNIRVLHFFR